MQTNRRTFIKSLAGAAGMSLSGVLPASMKTVSPADPFVIGLIGCKNMGWSDLVDFMKEPGVRCAALCDVDDYWLNKRAEDVEKMTGKRPKLYKDFRKLIERKDIDAVIIGTPDHWHCLQLTFACEAGKDVYVEKPLANTLAECDIMVRAAKKYNRVVQVGQQQRSAVEWKNSVQFVQSGRLGKIRTVKVWANFHYGAGRPAVPDQPVPEGVDFDMWLGPAPDRTFNINRFHGSWRMFWDYGGGLQTDWGVHLIDMGLWAMNITGPPKSTRATGGIFASRDRALETADTQHVLYAFDDFNMTWEHHGGIESGPWGRNYGIAFIGTNGTLVADRTSWEVLPEYTDETPLMDALPRQENDGLSHVYHVRNFIECVKSRRKPTCDVETGYLAALYTHLGNIAYRTGQILVWEDGTKRFLGCPEADALVKPNYRKPWVLPEID